jgi:hypothetical protein
MNTKTFVRRALQALALLGFLGGSGAWGQEKQLTTVTTVSGCTLSMEMTTGMRKLNWTGECKNNLLEGHGVLSYESSQTVTKDGRHLNWESKWVNAGLMREGKPEGLWTSADKKSKGIIFTSYRGGLTAGSMYFGDMTSDSNRKNTFGNVKTWLDEWSRGNLAAPRYAYLMAGLNAYYDNPNNFYSGNFSAPAAATVATSPAPTPAKQTSVADDPKVFGRSMRGG